VGVAAPAAIGCIEAAMRDLAAAAAALNHATATTATADSTRAEVRATHRRERMHRGLANLEIALRDTADVAAAARALAARGLSEHEP
jgi:hypothetical protein